MVRTRRSLHQHQNPTNKSQQSIIRRIFRRIRPTFTLWMPNNMAPKSVTKRIVVVAGLLCLALLFVTMGSVRKEENTINVEESKINEIQEEPIELPDLDGCTVGPATVAESEESSSNKPFWAPSYPASDNGLFAELVIGLTGGVGSNAKSYYASSSALKKCFSRNGHASLTVTCQQLHPIVGIGPLPENQADRFQQQILLLIRNPMTSVPEHYQQKAYMYHDANGQVSIDEWRSFRDEWFTRTVMTDWKSVITTWKNLKEYEGIGLYVPFEHVMDIHRGPILVNELASILRKSGFPVVSSDDVKCVWYKVTNKHFQAAVDESKKRNVSPQQMIQYPFAIDYIPRYTAHQKEYMITELMSLIDMYPNDTNLISILNEYIHQIQQSTINDRSANATMVP